MIHTTDAEAQAARDSAVADQDEIVALKTAIPSVDQLKGFSMKPLEFEKVCFMYIF